MRRLRGVRRRSSLRPVLRLRGGAAALDVLLRGPALRTSGLARARELARPLRARGRRRRRTRPDRRLVRRRRPREVRVPHGVQRDGAGVGRARLRGRLRRRRSARPRQGPPAPRQRLLPALPHGARGVLGASRQRWGRSRVVGLGRGHADAPPGLQDRRSEPGIGSRRGDRGRDGGGESRVPGRRPRLQHGAARPRDPALRLRRHPSGCLLQLDHRRGRLLQLLQRLRGRAVLGGDLALPGDGRSGVDGSSPGRLRPALDRSGIR